MEENGRWITLKDGRRIFINTNKYMNDFIRNSVLINKKQNNAKKLTEQEYQKLCDDFENSLTNSEKQEIKSYGIGGGISSGLNEPEFRKHQRTFRFTDENNQRGYTEKKLSYQQALQTKLDKKATNIITKDKNWDENIKFNYDIAVRDQKTLAKMDNIFEKKGISLNKDIIVYRKGYETLEDLQNGVIRYGYTSTSSTSRINSKTPGGLELGKNEFEIIVPSGMKFLPIENIVPDDVKKQKEILLPRNLKFEYLGNENNKYLVRAVKKIN